MQAPRQALPRALQGTRGSSPPAGRCRLAARCWRSPKRTPCLALVAARMVRRLLQQMHRGSSITGCTPHRLPCLEAGADERWHTCTRPSALLEQAKPGIAMHGLRMRPHEKGPITTGGVPLSGTCVQRATPWSIRRVLCQTSLLPAAATPRQAVGQMPSPASRAGHLRR